VKRHLLSNQKLRLDKKLFLTAFILVFVGIVAVAEASAPQALNVFNDKFRFLKDQLLWAAIGIVMLLITSKVSYKFWEKVATPFFLVNILLLVLVLIPGIGLRVFGARRWIPLPVFFQPSEIIKFGLVLFMAKMISKKKASVFYFTPLIIVAGLIMLEPDLGTTLIIILAVTIQIFASEINLLQFAGIGILGSLGVFILTVLSPYRKDRLLTFLEATRDPLGKSYHIRQVLLALGSGGLFGVGLGGSRQKYLFLPESSTDSIFAVIAEEIGFVGSFVIILIFAFFIFRAFKIARGAPDKFSQFLALGITAWIGGQTILNIASMTALVPLTGIPLPFISYGGSSLIMIMFATGILLNISKHASKK
jgi:cell division protein FtsW